MNAFRLTVMRRFNVQHGVEVSDFGMPGDHRATECTLERREAHVTLPIALEHELDAVSAKTAGAIVQENRSGLLSHSG